MLANEWKLVSGSEVEPVVKEVPPTLADWFVRGNYNEFELLKKAFTVEFHFKDQTTSFFKLLQSFTNINLARIKERKTKSSGYRCSPVDEYPL